MSPRTVAVRCVVSREFARATVWAAIGTLSFASGCSSPESSREALVISKTTSAVSSNSSHRAAAADGRIARHRPPKAWKLDGATRSEIAPDPAAQGAPAGPIDYHGGPVLKGTVKIYSIFYGSFPSSGNGSAEGPGPGAKVWQTSIGEFVNALSNSYWMDINQTYPGADGITPTETIQWAASVWDDSYSQGTLLNKEALGALIQQYIDAGTFPVDENGLYIVYGGTDVTEGGEFDQFCHTFCGWHTSTNAYPVVSIADADIKYAFIGDPEHCPATAPCTYYNSETPTGNASLDAIISETAHEIDETITDPDVSAYVTHVTQADGTIVDWENADRCAYRYGTVVQVNQSGFPALANIKLSNDKYYLIQENWVNLNTPTSKGFCNMWYAETSGVVISHVGMQAVQAIRNGARVTTGSLTLGADGAVYGRTVSNGTWSAASAISSSSFAPATAGVAVGAQSSTVTDAFLVGNDGKVYATTQTNGGAWSALSPLTGASFAAPGSLVTTGTPGGQLAVFVVDTNGTLQMIARSAGAWQAPRALTSSGYAPSGSALAVGTRSTGELDVFAVGTDGALKYMFFNLNLWGGPLTLSSTGFAPPGAPVTAARDVHNFLNVMTIGNNGALYTDWDVTPAWSGPTALTPTGYAPPGGVVSAINNNNHALYAFLVDEGGNVQALSNAGLGWQTTLVAPNATLPGAPASPAIQGSNEVDLFVSTNTTASGLMESTSTGGAWSALTALP